MRPTNLIVFLGLTAVAGLAFADGGLDGYNRLTQFGASTKTFLFVIVPILSSIVLLGGGVMLYVNRITWIQYGVLWAAVAAVGGTVVGAPWLFNFFTS
jgi:hypothetical protein